MGRRLRLSVIIPAYQAQDTIKNCIDSISCHEGDFEIIVVDDGSKDNTPALLDELAKANEHLKVVHVKNGGVSRARNIGLERAEGEYISFVDADDVVSDDYFDSLLNAAGTHEASLVIMNGKVTSSENISGNYYIERGILEADTHAWGKLYSRQLLFEKDRLKVRFPEDLTIGEDMLFVVDALLEIGERKEVICISGDGYHYTENEQGAMLGRFKESFLDEIICWKKLGKTLEKKGLAKDRERKAKLSTHQVMASLLTVSKFAASTPESEDDVQMMEVVKDRLSVLAKGTVKKALKNPGTFGMLSTGYKIKVCIYTLSENLYMRLYRQWKK